MANCVPGIIANWLISGRLIANWVVGIPCKSEGSASKRGFFNQILKLRHPIKKEVVKWTRNVHHDFLVSAQRRK